MVVPGWRDRLEDVLRIANKVSVVVTFTFGNQHWLEGNVCERRHVLESSLIMICFVRCVVKVSNSALLAIRVRGLDPAGLVLLLGLLGEYETLGSSGQGCTGGQCAVVVKGIGIARYLRERAIAFDYELVADLC